ncbi:S41 family peptidase [Aquimarina gracilis]|uniref:S41 family peptidase n=1 Tax=Aquimarina gracilis TaxID=874422 RepID=A0ABU5ZXT5_9FLAO|nr:S41 family peptidase [Aquimarina gracilis]MEB3346689.1 S41 family peptidase [Aquimarina gracilis]
MKSIFAGTTLCFLFFSLSAHSQNEHVTVRDSINTFYNKLFEALEENYLYTKDIDWLGLKPYIKKKALKSRSFEESLKISVKLFDTINGNHLLLFSEKDWYKSTLGKQLSHDQFNQSLADAYENGKSFEAKVIEKEYGYVFIPGMLLKDATREELDQAGQKIYDAITKIDQSHNIKGWIIDLRLNIGGNSNVMLAGLYHLLGNGTTHLSLDIDKHVKILTSMHNGTLYKNHKINTAIKPNLKPKSQVPVALISGIMTNSAGEFVILGFRGRKNTIVIGEESHGNTTANDLYELPYNTKAAITESYGTDRSAKFTKTIIPDIEVIKQHNFENLAKDKNIIMAMEFINSKQ